MPYPWLSRLVLVALGVTTALLFFNFLPELPPWVARLGLVIIGTFCLLQAKFDWRWSDDLNTWQSELFEGIFGRKFQRAISALLGAGLIVYGLFFHRP